MTGPGRELPAPQTQTELLAWLLEVLRPTNRTRVKQLLRSGQVAVNGVPTTRHDHPLRMGDRVAIARDAPTPHASCAAVAVVHLDDSAIAIDKPAGLLSVATEGEKLDTAFVRLKEHLTRQKAGRPFVVHRLDRETSGLLLFARSADIRDRLQADWEKVAKTYLAIVEGEPNQGEGTIDNFLVEGRDLRVRVARPSAPDAKRAVTRYRVLATRGPYSLVEVALLTGRKHQIRVHLAELGHPVIGDVLYGAVGNPAGRLGLHAWRLSFDHPRDKHRVDLEARFPQKLERVVELP